MLVELGGEEHSPAGLSSLNSPHGSLCFTKRISAADALRLGDGFRDGEDLWIGTRASRNGASREAVVAGETLTLGVADNLPATLAESGGALAEQKEAGGGTVP